MKIRFLCEYNGKNYYGFQRQKNLPTIQSKLEDALSKFFGGNIKIHGSGRTDTGVHAVGQVCHFEIDKIGDLYKLQGSINSFLPKDIVTRDFQIVDDNFHARYSAKSKTYIYKCYISKTRRPLLDPTHLQLPHTPDPCIMRGGAKVLSGTRCFRDFTTDKEDGKNFIRTIDIQVKSISDEEIWFIVTGDGFLRNMVRIIVGTLLNLKKTAPSNGLVLERVDY